MRPCQQSTEKRPDVGEVAASAHTAGAHSAEAFACCCSTGTTEHQAHGTCSCLAGPRPHGHAGVWHVLLSAMEVAIRGAAHLQDPALEVGGHSTYAHC